jgi:hypothetical protein
VFVVLLRLIPTSRNAITTIAMTTMNAMSPPWLLLTGTVVVVWPAVPTVWSGVADVPVAPVELGTGVALEFGLVLGLVSVGVVAEPTPLAGG